MYQNGVPVEHTRFLQSRYLGIRVLVRTFCGVDNEWPVSRSTLANTAHVRAEIERVRPPVPAQNAYREASRENGGIVRIVMRDRGYAAQQILDATPGQPDALRDKQMFPYGRFMWPVNIRRPLRSAGIRADSEAGEKIELQMVVGVDQPGKN